MTDDLDNDFDLVEGITTGFVDPWDSKTGKLAQLSEEIIAGMQPQKREAWLALAAASNDLETAEDEQRQASKNVHQCASDAAEAQNMLVKARPVISARAAHLAAIAAHRSGKGTSAAQTSKEIKDAEAAVVAADKKLGLAHKAFHRNKDAVEAARATFFAALVKWNDVQPRPTLKNLIVAVGKTQAAREDDAAKHTAAAPPSHVDFVMRNNRGRRGRNYELPGKSPMKVCP